MSLKDDLNKGFTIGDITTSKYDDEAKIKVKEYYELDKLERSKLLELAGAIDIELTKRDIKLSGMEEKTKNIENKTVEVEKRVKDIENNGVGTSSKAYYKKIESSLAYVYHKFEVPQEELDALGELNLEKYNKLSLSDQTMIKNVLLKAGIEDPTNLEALKNELLVSGSQVASLILKVYGNSLRIPINKEFTFIVPDKIGLSRIAVKSKVLDVVLAKLPNGKYDCTHSVSIGSITNSKAISIYAGVAYPYQDVGTDSVFMINYLENGEPSNKFGLTLAGSYSSLFDTPYSITGEEIEEVKRSAYNTVSNFLSNASSKTITLTDKDYGDTTPFSFRTVRIGNQEKFLTYEISVRYNNNGAGGTIVDNLPAFYLPYYNSPYAKGVDFVFFGSDNSVTKGELIGTSTTGGVGRIYHRGVTVAGITYTAKFQARGAFQ